MASILWRKDVASQVGGVRDTFSSWDKCMAKTYCKWPVIIAIIVVSCIVLSIVFCVARCLCCGAECACCCFRCCVSCCPSPSRKHKRADSPLRGGGGGGGGGGYGYAPTNNQYQSHAAPRYEPPQFATFDAPSKPVNDDALPAMPSWGDATSKKVEEEHKHEDVEMNNLSKEGVAAVPALTTPAGPSPIRSPGSTVQKLEGYGFPNSGYNSQNGSYANGINRQPSPNYRNGQETGVYHNNGYHSPSPGPGHSPVYDQQSYHDTSPTYAGQGGAYGGQYGGQSQQQGGYRNGGHSPHSPYHDQQRPFDNYNGGNQSYGQMQPPQPRRSPAPQNNNNFDRQNSYEMDAGYAPSPISSRGYAPSGTTYGGQQGNMHLASPQQRSPTGGWHSGPRNGGGAPRGQPGWRDV